MRVLPFIPNPYHSLPDPGQSIILAADTSVARAIEVGKVIIPDAVTATQVSVPVNVGLANGAYPVRFASVA